jgi:hypothetical protein
MGIILFISYTADYQLVHFLSDIDSCVLTKRLLHLYEITSYASIVH